MKFRVGVEYIIEASGAMAAWDRQDEVSDLVRDVLGWDLDRGSVEALDPDAWNAMVEEFE